VRSEKPIKLDSNHDYPCPCRRKGRLLPITLTEAFGCDRCQQIFAIDEKHQEIELLSSAYPYKRIWRWTGYRWRALQQANNGSLPLFLGLILMILMGWLFLALHSLPSLSMILGIMVSTTLILFFAYTLWLAYRR
jgi:hypothetical protein